MTAETIFTICNILVLPQWVLMIVAPQAKVTQYLANTYAIPLLLALVYAYLLATHSAEVNNGGFSSLAQVKNLFSNDYIMVGGWVHYLAFDLIIGSWMLKDAHKERIIHWLIIPCLLLTFMLGPLGFLVYKIMKRIYPTQTTASFESI
jgi:hypothetical protein